MRNRIVFSFLFVVLHLAVQAQISFGLKAGGAIPFSLEIRPSNKDTKESFSYQVEEYRTQYNIDNQYLLDSLVNIYSTTSGGLVNLEYGAYFSIPAGLRSRIRFEMAYHNYELEDAYPIEYENCNCPESAIPLGSNGIDQGFVSYSDGSFYLVNKTKQQFIRPSIHYHYYITKNTALNAGFSYSIAMKDINVRGHLVTFQRTIIQSSNYHETFNIEVDAFNTRYSKKSQGMFGLNLGFLTKLGGVLKVEVRGAYYFYPQNIGLSIMTQAKYLGMVLPVTYEYSVKHAGIQTISLFIEL